MAQGGAKIRLFIAAPLHPGVEIALERPQAHYLFTVMRLAAGDSVLLFNGEDGEWRAEAVETGKKRGVLRCAEQTRAQDTPPDIELLFAPIKKARTDFIVEKACEMGCARVRPVLTRYTNSERLNLERLRAHMVEAAEQCGGLSVPGLLKAEPLMNALAGWDAARTLIFCDERRDAPLLPEAVTDLPRGAPCAVLIGPEGGFSDEEAERLRAAPFARAVSLGPRVLRADTAAVAALALAQSRLGDW